jgi:hypothetical protein
MRSKANDMIGLNGYPSNSASNIQKYANLICLKMLP